MSSELVDPRPISGPATVASLWLATTLQPVADDLLGWPPDVFAFTDAILERTEAYRFAVSSPPGRSWPPDGTTAWQQAVEDNARRWSDGALAESADLPELVIREWDVVRGALDVPLDDIASGDAWRVCEALLTLHALADEACAGLAAGTPAPDAGVLFRARMGELLARTGTLSRIDPGVLRVLPKYRTAGRGLTSRSISRYASRTGPAVNYKVHRVAAPGRDAASRRLNILMLPWPLQVSAEDFHPVPNSVYEREVEPIGFFGFRPAEPLDVVLVDRLLASAAEHADQVDVVVLPESSVAEEDVARLEAVLSRHGVPMLIAGVRAGSEPGAFGSNWVHFGASVDDRWWHYRQDKHHRWSLERSQIEQYHLEEVLDPRVRWWEAIAIKPRSLEILERDDGETIAALVCEDLAQLDEVADLLRTVGPTLVVAILLDGPQLASRWAARYASVLADDPGSGVLTLTSYGMVASAWRDDRPASSVVALWKDNARGQREIELEDGAQGILLSLERHRAMRRAADGRAPQLNSSELGISAITQLRAAAADRQPAAAEAELQVLSPADRTVLLSWSDALAHVRATDPRTAESVIAEARPAAGWRSKLGLERPAGALAEALDMLGSDGG